MHSAGAFRAEGASKKELILQLRFSPGEALLYCFPFFDARISREIKLLLVQEDSGNKKTDFFNVLLIFQVSESGSCGSRCGMDKTTGSLGNRGVWREKLVTFPAN